jgi:hypothetical protein
MSLRDVYTESGTRYRLDFTAGTVVRFHGMPMRGDGAVLRMHWCGHVRVGDPLRIMLEPLGEGTYTFRTSSPVERIELI